jgi:hypothetical protein
LAIFRLTVAAYAVSLLSALTILLGVVVSLVAGGKVNLQIAAYTFFGSALLRIALGYWLSRLGGVPGGAEKK